MAYIPVTRKEKEPAAAERARLRRSGVSQRVVYLAFRSAIGASHAGVEFDGLGDRTLRAFPRILLYLSDQPEERAVLCLKSGICDYPCSMCNVSAKEFGAEQALAAGDREVVLSQERQVEAAKLLRAGKDNRRLAHLEEYGSLQSCVPALASMAGLSKAPFCWYRMMGLDALLVLDLGVTRLLIQRLVRIYPYMWNGFYPLLGSFAATYRAANNRLEHLGRRSKARSLAPG